LVGKTLVLFLPEDPNSPIKPSQRQQGCSNHRRQQNFNGQEPPRDLIEMPPLVHRSIPFAVQTIECQEPRNGRLPIMGRRNFVERRGSEHRGLIATSAHPGIYGGFALTLFLRGNPFFGFSTMQGPGGTHSGSVTHDRAVWPLACILHKSRLRLPVAAPPEDQLTGRRSRRRWRRFRQGFLNGL